jgi:hypothetical protein
LLHPFGEVFNDRQFMSLLGKGGSATGILLTALCVPNRPMLVLPWQGAAHSERVFIRTLRKKTLIRWSIYQPIAENSGKKYERSAPCRGS